MDRQQQIEHLKDCESREWIYRYQAKAKELGKAKASAWWRTTIADISRRRGETAANDLRNRMNQKRSK